MPRTVNSFYIIDDEKRRGKMTKGFYAAANKDISGEGGPSEQV